MTHTTPPLKLPNLEKRTREHLLPNEVEAMIKAASSFGRHGYRDSTLTGLTQLAQRDRNFIVFTYYVKVAYPEGIAEINNSNWLC